MKHFVLFLFLFVAVDALCQSLSLKRIFDKPYIAGSRPDIAAVSPDGSQFLYQWDSTAKGRNRLWAVSTSGGATHQVVDSAVSSCVWSPDVKQIAFTQDGDVFLTDPLFKKTVRLTKTPGGEGQLTWSDDGKLLAFATDNIFVMPVNRSGLSQLTNNSSPEISYSIIKFSPDSKRVLFTEYSSEGVPEFLVPRYTDTDVTAPKSKRGYGKVRIGIAPVDTGKTVWLKTDSVKFLLSDVRLSPDGKRVLYEQFSTNRKTRRLYVCDMDSGKSRLVYSEYDPKYIKQGYLGCDWTPDGKSIVFTSEKDGWNHLYTMTKDSSVVRQLTSGAWEIHWFSVHPDGKQVYFNANKEEHAQWQIYSLRLKDGSIDRLSKQIGTYESPVVSKTGEVIVCEYSNFTSPTELYALHRGKEQRLTYTLTKEFQSIEWAVPEVVHFTARDSTVVPAMIYKPKQLDVTRKYPCVVFVHGAGYTQNVYRGWSYYYREFIFNTYLVNKGYIVFEVDYRGSAGYGRKFHQDVYLHLGGLDLQDELDGVEYLKRLGYIDSARIGMYGGSYGGFLPLMALFRSPETYACAAVLRAVTSWENYYRHNPWWTEPLLGKPEDNPEAYKISSPLTYADSLTKPLLILHGVMDDNVFFQDAAQLVNKLQKAGKKFELMVYPAEAHSFTQPESWYDEYSRIDEFFDKHLRK